MRRARRRAAGPALRRAVHHVPARAGAAHGRRGARLVPGTDGGAGRAPYFRLPEDPDGDWDGALPDPALVEEAWRLLRAEQEFGDAFVARAPSLDLTGEAHGEPVSLREVLVHLVEEYARHNGHADFLRERIDGRVGQ